MAFSKKQRLSGKEIKTIIDHGLNRKGRWLTLIFDGLDHGGRLKTQVVISKKQEKSAAMRNKLKRIVFQAIKDNKQALSSLGWVLVLVKKWPAKEPIIKLAREIIFLTNQ